MTDPFQTAALRDGVLAAWRDSPTRFREDANAEEDLYLGGYRDRLFVELAQNAADAAGNRAKATEYYGKLVDLAKNADAERQEVREAKAFLARR